MITYISNVLRIVYPSKEVAAWVSDNLDFPNPQYAKRVQMGLFTGGVPRRIKLYEWQSKNTLIIPYGCIYQIGGKLKAGEVVNEITHNHIAQYQGYVELFKYQQEALYKVIERYCGLLIAPAGSGKTQIGLAICQVLHRRALWVTHTLDLLDQSYERAKRYFNEDVLGKITEGSVNCGSFITFATVQTLRGIDLNRYRDYWDVIIVDEAHRVCVSATSVSMFEKVLNNLSARWKYGLTATDHRADGLIKCTHAILGPVIYELPESAVADKIMKPTIVPIPTGCTLSEECYKTDGMLDHPAMMNYLVRIPERNKLIIDTMIANKAEPSLILSSRVEHLRALFNELPPDMQMMAAVIDGAMVAKWQKEIRKNAIEQMRVGGKLYLFATYGLAKEGLDIPRLTRLYLATPQKDYAVTTQSIGRVSRTYPGKTEALVYDFVDNDAYLLKLYKARKTHYRKNGCKIKEE